MTILILLSLLIGAVLGMRFKVFILGPIIVANVIIMLVGGAVAGIDFSTLSLAAVLAIIGLQIGYFSGIITRFSMALARSGRSAKVPRTELKPTEINEWPR
jgi:uncharacterized membrane protein YccF (DUF307 family)